MAMTMDWHVSNTMDSRNVNQLMRICIIWRELSTRIKKTTALLTTMATHGPNKPIGVISPHVRATLAAAPTIVVVNNAFVFMVVVNTVPR